MSVRVAKRYAVPLISLAGDNKKLDIVKSDLKTFLDLHKVSRDLKSMLNSPIIPIYKKTSIITSLFKDKFDSLTCKFLGFVVRKGRGMYLQGIAAEFIRLYNQKLGLQPVKITTAVQLSNESNEKIADLSKEITGNEPVTKIEIDPTIIGGYVLEFRDQRIDASVKGQLNRLNKKLKK